MKLCVSIRDELNQYSGIPWSYAHGARVVFGSAINCQPQIIQIKDRSMHVWALTVLITVLVGADANRQKVDIWNE